MPSREDLPTPEPAKIPRRWPRPQGNETVEAPARRARRARGSAAATAGRAAARSWSGRARARAGARPRGCRGRRRPGRGAGSRRRTHGRGCRGEHARARADPVQLAERHQQRAAVAEAHDLRGHGGAVLLRADEAHLAHLRLQAGRLDDQPDQVAYVAVTAREIRPSLIAAPAREQGARCARLAHPPRSAVSSEIAAISRARARAVCSRWHARRNAATSMHELGRGVQRSGGDPAGEVEGELHGVAFDRLGGLGAPATPRRAARRRARRPRRQTVGDRPRRPRARPWRALADLLSFAVGQRERARREGGGGDLACDVRRRRRPRRAASRCSSPSPPPSPLGITIVPASSSLRTTATRRLCVVDIALALRRLDLHLLQASPRRARTCS